MKDARELGEFVAEAELPGPLTPKPAMVAVVPIDKAPAAYIAAVVSVGSDLAGFLSETGLPDGSSARIIDDSGHVLASSVPGAPVGGVLPVKEIVDQVVAGSAEGTVEASGLDPARSVYSYADIGPTNQTAFSLVGIPSKSAFAAADRQLRANLIAGAIVTTLALLAALAIGELSVARPVRTILATVRRIGRGDLDARTGATVRSGEMRDLAGAVDEMASDLQERDESLRTASDERERLLSELLGAQEQERSRIAADIHDDTIQAMVAAGLEAQLLRRRLEAPDDVERAAKVEQTIQRSIGRLRHLVFELEPPATDVGLEEGIELFLDGLLVDYDVEVDLHTDADLEPTGLARHVLFRNIREAALNAVRHGGADRLEIEVESERGGIATLVRDDGSGFDASERLPVDHHGVRTMRERAEALGGDFHIDSAAGAGTTVSFWLPL